MEIGSGEFKRIWKKGRIVSSTNNNEYVIETFPNQGRGENQIACEDCEEVGAKFIRVYTVDRRHKVYSKTVCSRCCKSGYE